MALLETFEWWAIGRGIRFGVKIGKTNYMQIQAVTMFQNEICTSHFSVGKDMIITNCCTLHMPLRGKENIEKSYVQYSLAYMGHNLI